MNGVKRSAVEASDALELLRKLATVVSAEVYDVIVQILIDAGAETDGSTPQQFVVLEEILMQNLGHYPELLNEFKDFFSEECQSVVQKAKKESKSSPPVDIPDPRIRLENLQRLKKQLHDAQKCDFEEALDLNKKTNESLEMPDLSSRFDQSIKSFNKREINLETFLEQILIVFIGNEHLLPLLVEFLVLDDQDPEDGKTLALFKEQFQKYNYTNDAEKLVNHHLKYLKRLEREVNNISAVNRTKALLVLLNLEIVDLEQVKTMLLIAMRNEPPSALETLRELFESLESLESEQTANKNKLLQELEDSESIRRDYYLKPANQLNLKRMEPCTTSYAFLPLDYPILKASGRTRLGDSVLNDRIIVISSGAENVDEECDNSDHESCLFELEDEMHDALRMLDLMKTTLKTIEENSVLIRDLTDEEASALMNKNMPLKTIHLTCIRSLFESEVEKLSESVKAHPKYNFRLMSKSLTLKISEWKRHLSDLKQKWHQSYQKNFMESLDQPSNEASVLPELNQLKREYLLKEISEASNHSSESPKKSKIQMIDFEECRNKPDMILDFSNSLMAERDLCFWAVEEAIKASYEGPGLTNRCLVWQRFILAFFQVEEGDQNTNSASDRTNLLRRQSSSKFMMLRQVMKELSETGETYCYCSESLYCLFRYLSILCSRLRLLRNAPQEQNSKRVKIKTAISDFLYSRIHRRCFEEELTILAGMKISSLFAIPHLLKKIIGPMEKLLMHPVTALLEEQAKCLLSTPEDQSEAPEKQSFNEIKSLMKLQSLCPGKRLFRVAYDTVNEKLKIKEVTKKAKALPEMLDSMGHYKSRSKSKSRTQNRSPLFLNRNLKGVCSPRWPKYLLHEHLIHQAESDRIAYDRAREDWMISLRRQLPNYALIEAKRITVSNWISQCTADRRTVFQTKLPKSKGGAK